MMIKFIHAADIHLDSPLRGLSRYESAPVDTIRGACRRAFENLVELAIEENVSFVLLAGDLYDGDWKDYSTGIFLSQQMGRLGQHGIQVYAVAGNHDAASKITKALDSPANMKMFSSRKVETIEIEDLNIAIHGRSFGSQRVEKNLTTDFPLATPGRFNIGLLHTSLDGREGHASYAPCSLDDLHSKGYQYWALGHIHKQEFVSRDPLIVFPGCLQGRHIRETGAKGCVLVSVEDNAVAEIESIQLDVFRWTQCDIDLTDVEDLREALERVRKSIEDARTVAENKPLAMRIHLTGSTTVSDELASYPEKLEQQIKALAAEIGYDELWIERVENTTQNKLSLDSTLDADSALGDLLQEILKTPNHPDEIIGLRETIAEIRQKLPSDISNPDSNLQLDDEQTLRQLIEEAKQMLIGRLLTVGGSK